MASQVIGRSLMLALGLYFWLYVFRPQLPLVRGLSWWYADLAPELLGRIWFGFVGTILIIGGVLL